MSSPPEVERYILRFLVSQKEVLDIGAGLGKNGYLIRVFKKPRLLVGTDVFRPYLQIVKYHRVYDHVVLCDAAFLPFGNNSFDIVLASEVLEHLSKKFGSILLNEVERVCRERIVVITPNKAQLREGQSTFVGFNPYEAHKSSWTVGCFKNRGYNVFGTGFLFCRRFGRYSRYFNLLFAYFTALLPNIADELIAVKDLKSNRGGYMRPNVNSRRTI